MTERERRMRPSALEAAYQVLLEEKRPMHADEITRLILDRGLWSTKGKTPSRTVVARIGEEINRRGNAARFRRVGSGAFELIDSDNQNATR